MEFKNWPSWRTQEWCCYFSPILFLFSMKSVTFCITASLTYCCTSTSWESDSLSQKTIFKGEPSTTNLPLLPFKNCYPAKNYSTALCGNKWRFEDLIKTPPLCVHEPVREQRQEEIQEPGSLRAQLRCLLCVWNQYLFLFWLQKIFSHKCTHTQSLVHYYLTEWVFGQRSLQVIWYFFSSFSIFSY